MADSRQRKADTDLLYLFITEDPYPITVIKLENNVTVNVNMIILFDSANTELNDTVNTKSQLCYTRLPHCAEKGICIDNTILSKHKG